VSAKRRAGVVTFAGVLFLIAALFNIIDGLVALDRSSYYTVGENHLVIKDFTAWGIVLLVLGGVQLFVGWGILARAVAAQVLGIILAGVSALFHLAFFIAYPAWSAIILIVDAVIIYALTVHGEEFSTGRARRRAR
jgi:hypothetical protein